MLVAESSPAQSIEVVFGNCPRLTREFLREGVQGPIGLVDRGSAVVTLETFDEGVVLDLGPEVSGVRLDSIVTLVRGRHDDGEHLALCAAELGRAVHDT